MRTGYRTMVYCNSSTCHASTWHRVKNGQIECLRCGLVKVVKRNVPSR